MQQHREPLSAQSKRGKKAEYKSLTLAAKTTKGRQEKNTSVLEEASSTRTEAAFFASRRSHFS
jgi:hypothetical protein